MKVEIMNCNPTEILRGIFLPLFVIPVPLNTSAELNLDKSNAGYSPEIIREIRLKTG